MPVETAQKMDGKRLEEVAKFLFPNAGRSWKRKIAGAMRIHVTTVRRWVINDAVPGGYDGFLESLCVIKSMKNTDR